MRKICTAILSTAALVATSAPSYAATETTTFGVSATITDSCSVTASALGFGDIDPVANVDVDATTTMDVTCSTSTAYDVGLDAGTTTGATVTARQMTDGTNLLDYALYSDSARTTNWGDTVGTDTVAGTGDGTAQTLTVYGRVPSGYATTPTGAYSDTITVTVTY